LHSPIGRVKTGAELNDYTALQRLALPVLVLLCVIVACSA
jgi:hypothetical protein